MSTRNARGLLFAALMTASLVLPARAQTLAPSAPASPGDVEPGLAPLWDAGRARWSGQRARATAVAPLAPFVTASLPEDAAWEAWVTPAVTTGAYGGVEYHGKLYLASSMGGRAFGGVVSWDGTHFEATPDFPGGAIAIGVWNDRLVVDAGGRILAFNGVGWDTLGHPNDYVNAICAHGPDLVIAGQFKSVDGVPAKGIARFDGSAWTDMGSNAFTGTNVGYALCEYAGKLVVGGTYPTLKNIAIWDDIGATWQTPGAGFNKAVRALASDATKLYAAGDFSLTGTTPMVARAEWNGATWTQIPTGGVVQNNAITAWNGGAVVSGGAGAGSALAFWNGSALTPMADSLTVFPLHLFTWGGRLVATGNFLSMGSRPAPRVAIFDGASWSTAMDPWASDMLSPEGAPITDITTWNGQLIVGGSFGEIAERDQYIGVNVAGIGSWDGAQWSTLDRGLFASTRWFGTYQGDLVATGWGVQALTSVSTVVKNVVRWDGSSWSGFGTPPFDFGYAIQEFHGDLYVGHEDQSDGIRRWNGSTWTTLGSGLYSAYFGYGAAYGLAPFGDSLAVGGAFDTAGGLPVANVAFWDGAAWHTAGAGFDDWVAALAVWNGQLIAGGPFTHSGAQAVQGCAVWDGAAWQPFGTNAVEIEKLLSVDGMLFAAGDFRLPDNSVVETVARWDGSDWHILGSGTNTYAIAVHDGYLYNAGSGLIHGHVSHGLSRIPLYATLDAPLPKSPGLELALSLWPNPTRGAARCRFTLPKPGNARVAIFDVTGRTVATLADGPFAAGPHDVRWDAHARAGVYFARIDAGSRHVSRRFVVLER